MVVKHRWKLSIAWIIWAIMWAIWIFTWLSSVIGNSVKADLTDTDYTTFKKEQSIINKEVFDDISDTQWDIKAINGKLDLIVTSLNNLTNK